MRGVGYGRYVWYVRDGMAMDADEWTDEDGNGNGNVRKMEKMRMDRR